MDTAPGPAAPAVSRAAPATHGASLYQLLPRLLTTLRARHPELDDEALQQRLEFRANPSLGFPARDIARVDYLEEQGECRVQLRLNVLGLSGGASPLPGFYASMALGDDGQPVRAFLDLFNDRLQRLLLPVWRKYRYPACFQPGARDAFSQRLFALAGVADPRLRDTSALDWQRLLPYLGVLGMRAHSASLITTLLRYYFAHAELHVEPCSARRLRIDPGQRNRLGQANHRLGDSLVLGATLRDRSGRFRIRLAQLSWPRLQTFLPDGAAYRPLQALVRLLLRDPLEHELRLELAAGALRPLRLDGGRDYRLGWTTWLGPAVMTGGVTLAPRPLQG
ncbi:type VI secretion system baseplate subunit TssG [Pseudomonas sp. UL073]|uniref:Type VI secretion system baseplate subunit TssG n=1 Tax=Zestomonas insulae TaxID=2809017 RepID=A0ABS2IJY4_9GAMM|nr:type VI secretion system baseplate subunit TssG [Pseudomonas insulae]MBM7063366.1 type VI secretion system baseplate subunit TssG [Pseudomonas insulae]